MDPPYEPSSDLRYKLYMVLLEMAYEIRVQKSNNMKTYWRKEGLLKEILEERSRALNIEFINVNIVDNSTYLWRGKWFGKLINQSDCDMSLIYFLYCLDRRTNMICII